MAHYHDFFPPKDWLRASDLGEKDVSVIIEKIVSEELQMEGGKKERRCILSFKGAKKRFVLNITNAKTIARIYGRDTAAWIGQKIILFPTETKFGSETVECIRIKKVTA